MMKDDFSTNLPVYLSISAAVWFLISSCICYSFYSFTKKENLPAKDRNILTGALFIIGPIVVTIFWLMDMLHWIHNYFKLEKRNGQEETGRRGSEDTGTVRRAESGSGKEVGEECNGPRLYDNGLEANNNSRFPNAR